MSRITTYAALKNAVQSWLNRNDQDTIDNIPMFINFAEKDFQRTMSLPYYEVPFTGTVGDPNSPNVTTTGFKMPVDYYEMKHVLVNGIPYNRVDYDAFKRLISKEFQYNQSLGPVDASQSQGTSQSKFVFARRNGYDFVVNPPLKDGDYVEAIYWQEIPEMTSDSDAPQTLVDAPDVMLYLALRHAAVFLRDNEQAQFWEQKANIAGEVYQKRLGEIEWSGSPVVVPSFNS